MKKALHPLIVRRDVGPHDLDDPKLVEMNVTDLEDLSHAADTEAVEDLILAVDQLRRVRALKTGDALRAVRALIELAIDGLFAT